MTEISPSVNLSLEQETPEFIHELIESLGKLDLSRFSALSPCKKEIGAKSAACVDLKNKLYQLSDAIQQEEGVRSFLGDGNRATLGPNLRASFGKIAEAISYVKHFSKMKEEEFFKNSLNQRALEEVVTTINHEAAKLINVQKYLTNYRNQNEWCSDRNFSLGTLQNIMDTVEADSLQEAYFFSKKQERKATQNPYCHSDLERLGKDESTIIATINPYGGKVDFVVHGIQQCDGLRSVEVEKNSTEIVDGKILGEITENNKGLRPLNTELMPDGIHYVERNDYTLSPSKNKPSDVFSVDAKILRDELFGSDLFVRRVKNAVEYYASQFTYVTSTDINYAIEKIAEKTRLPMLLIFDALKVGQCFSQSLLANYVLQDIIPCGVAGGYAVSEGNIYSNKGHAIFCFQGKRSNKIESVDMTKFNRETYKNLELEERDRKTLFDFVDRITNSSQKISSSEVFVILSEIKNWLHKALKNPQYNSYKNHTEVSASQEKISDAFYLDGLSRKNDSIESKELHKILLEANRVSEKQYTSSSLNKGKYFNILFSNDLISSYFSLMEQMFRKHNLDGVGKITPANIIRGILTSKKTVSIFEKRFNFSPFHNIPDDVHDMIADINEKLILHSPLSHFCFKDFLSIVLKSYSKLIEKEKPEIHRKSLSTSIFKNMNENFSNCIHDFLCFYDQIDLMQSKNKDANTNEQFDHLIRKKSKEKDLYEVRELRPYHQGDDLRHLNIRKSINQLLIKVFDFKTKPDIKQQESAHLDVELMPKHVEVSADLSELKLSSSPIAQLAVCLYRSYDSDIRFDSCRFTFFGIPVGSHGIQEMLRDLYKTEPFEKEKRREIIATVASLILKKVHSNYHHKYYDKGMDFTKDIFEKIQQQGVIENKVLDKKYFYYNHENKDLWREMGLDDSFDFDGIRLSDAGKLATLNLGEFLSCVNRHSQRELVSLLAKDIDMELSDYIYDAGLSDDDHLNFEESDLGQRVLSWKRENYDSCVKSVSNVFFNGNIEKAKEYLSKPASTHFIPYIREIREKFVLEVDRMKAKKAKV